MVLELLKVSGVPNPPGEREVFGVGRAVPVRGAVSFTPFFTKQALWAVVRFAKRAPRPPSANPPSRPVGLVGNLVIFGLALAVGFGLAFAAAKEVGTAPNMTTATERERNESVRMVAREFMGSTKRTHFEFLVRTDLQLA